MDTSRNANVEADEIARMLERNDVFPAQIRLAEDYLTMQAGEFRAVLNSMKSKTAKSKQDVYESPSKDADTGNISGKEIYLNDGIFTDTRLIGLYRDIVPRSKALADDKLEQAARRFNNMLGTHTTNEGKAYFGADDAATTALLNFAESLPKNDAAMLMQRAEEINQELGRYDRPSLRVSLKDLDGDGIPNELNRVQLVVPFRCSRGDYHLSTWNYK